MREDKHYDTAVLPKSSGFEKGVYSVGCIGANFCWAFVASYITMYYTDCVGLSASVAGAILLISRFLDGLSDILCAWMFKKVHFKSGNKIRPWFLVSAPLLGISMLLMFHIPSGFSKSGQSVYAFLTYAFMAAGAYTIFCLAQSAIVTVVSYDSSDRARFTACGNAVINTSTILLNVLTPFLLLAGGGTKNQSGWHLISVIYAIMTTILIMLLGIFLKEKTPPAGYNDAEETTGNKVKFGTILKYLLKEKWTWLILLMFIFGWLLQGFQGIEAYFYRDVMEDLRLYSTLGNVYIAASVVGILLGPIAAKRWGEE